MILRKPYAFFIKHFKLIHIILAILMCYSIYRSYHILDFFNEYAASVINVTGQDLVGTFLYGIYTFIPMLIIALTTIILVVMVVKQKPTLFYIVNIAIFIFTFIIIQITHSTFINMQQTLIDVRTARLVRDLITISFITQIFSLFITIVRSIGFDINKFGFKQDLVDLQIEESDREEFEVQFSLDSNKSKRKLNYIIRNAKYIYLENKLTIFIISIFIILGIIGSVTYFTLNSVKVLNENEYFYSNNFTLTVTNSYITTTDYKGKVIDKDYAYVIIKLRIKNNIKTANDVGFATAKLKIGNYTYTPTIENKDSFLEFGAIYQGETIKSEFENKTLLYKIPIELKDKEMIFSFVDKTNVQKDGLYKKTETSLQLKDLTKQVTYEELQLNDILSFQNSVIENSILQISSFDIQKEYKLSYNFCISQECFPSFEYLKPSNTSNYDKAIIKLVGTFEKDIDILNGIYDLYDLIANFGTLEYTINDLKKTQNIPFKEVISKKVKEENTYYLEVLEEVQNADSIAINFKIRNKNYKYLLK